MSEGFPLDYTQHLQEVGHGLLNGTLDRATAVSRLIHKGWEKEEATAAVAEVAEQVETTKKLLRDAARVLDDTPIGQKRAAARLQEAGMSERDANTLVKHFNQQRHFSRGRLRYVVQGLRHRHLSRENAILELTQEGGMDEPKASTFIDVLTDSAAYWSAERLIFWLAVLGGSLLCTAVINVFLFDDLAGWLGLMLVAFFLLPLVMFFLSWKSARYWKDWSLRNEPARRCPRNCSPMVMLAHGKGEQATIITCTEWGIPRDEATQLVHYRARVNRRNHLCQTSLGISLILFALGSCVLIARFEPESLLPMSLIAGATIATASIFIWRGIRGWRLFSKP